MADGGGAAAEKEKEENDHDDHDDDHHHDESRAAGHGDQAGASPSASPSRPAGCTCHRLGSRGYRACT